MYICCVPGSGVDMKHTLNIVIINLANYRPWIIMIRNLLLFLLLCSYSRDMAR